MRVGLVSYYWKQEEKATYVVAEHVCRMSLGNKRVKWLDLLLFYFSGTALSKHLKCGYGECGTVFLALFSS